jgi:hypothetical protein
LGRVIPSKQQQLTHCTPFKRIDGWHQAPELNRERPGMSRTRPVVPRRPQTFYGELNCRAVTAGSTTLMVRTPVA